MAKQSLQTWNGRHKSLAFWFATGFGSGLLRPASGTWGSIAGLLIAIGAFEFSQIYKPVLLSFFGLIFALGSRAIDRIEKQTGIHDAPEIVIDEFVGQWTAIIPIYFVSDYSLFEYWPYLLSGFLLFRFFDILKPWPIGWIDRKMEGGEGVMADDLFAGIMAAIPIHLALTYFEGPNVYY